MNNSVEEIKPIKFTGSNRTMEDLDRMLSLLTKRHGLRLVKPHNGCPHDTDGDGNCHLCIRRPGGCFNK